VRTLVDTDEGTVIEVTGKSGLSWTIMVANGAASTTATHRVSANGRTFSWTGNYRVDGVKAR
jgi:hypothetical protein